MELDANQLKRNRAKVFVIAAGLFLLGSQGPDFGDLFGPGDRDHYGAREGQISIDFDHIDMDNIDTQRIEDATDRAIEMADRAVEMADRAAEAAERASEKR
jgi:hypothetical protein